MRHVQLVVATAMIETRPLPLRHGTLQVVDRHGALDWEVVLHTVEYEPVANDLHPLRLDVITGLDADGRLGTAELRGTAALVRAIEHTVVFRGDGDLVGFDTDLLT